MIIKLISFIILYFNDVLSLIVLWSYNFPSTILNG